MAKALAQVAADSGEYQAVILHHLQEILALLAHQHGRIQFAPGSISLNTMGANGHGSLQGFRNRQFEGFQHNANRKFVHEKNLLSLSVSGYIQYTEFPPNMQEEERNSRKILQKNANACRKAQANRLICPCTAEKGMI